MRRRGFVRQVIVSLKLSDNQENMTGEKGHEAGHQDISMNLMPACVLYSNFDAQSFVYALRRGNFPILVLCGICSTTLWLED